MPMRTCLLLPHAFKYKGNVALSSSAGERRYFHGICRMFHPEGSCATRAVALPYSGGMHFVHAHTHTRVSAHSRTLSSLFCLFFMPAVPDATFLYIHISFLFLQVSITRTCLPTDGETRRPGGGSLVTRVRRLKGTRTRVAPTAKKSFTERRYP